MHASYGEWYLFIVASSTYSLTLVHPAKQGVSQVWVIGNAILENDNAILAYFVYLFQLDI